jgi:hypothetical protein
LRGGDELSLLERALGVLRADARGRDLETFLVCLMHRIGGDEALMRLGARLDMATLQQIPWFDEIVDRGRREGAERATRDIIRRQPGKWVGRLPRDITRALAACDSARLEPLTGAVLEVASLEEFRARLKASRRAPAGEQATAGSV